jgi:hypothetical protein
MQRYKCSCHMAGCNSVARNVPAVSIKHLLSALADAQHRFPDHSLRDSKRCATQPRFVPRNGLVAGLLLQSHSSLNLAPQEEVTGVQVWRILREVDRLDLHLLLRGHRLLALVSSGVVVLEHEERLASRGWLPFTLDDALLHTCHTRPEAEEMQDHQQKRGWPREAGSHSRRRPAAFAPYNTTSRRDAQDSRRQFGNAFSLALVLSICLIYFYINNPLCKSTTMFAFSCSVCPGLARRPGWPSWACLPEGQIFKDCGASWLELNNCEHTNKTT